MAAEREHAIREAMSANVHAIGLDAQDPLRYAQRASIHIWDARLDRFPDALRDARRAHEMNPTDAFVLRTLALGETYVGEHEQAIKHLHQVVRLSHRLPSTVLTYNHLTLATFGAQ